MKRNPCKLCREPWSKDIQHLPPVKAKTKRESRKFRRLTRTLLRLGLEPPVAFSGGERY